MPDLEKALAALKKRFARAQAKDDARELLTAGARREARAVAALCDPARDLAAVHALGWYHWMCDLSLRDGDEYRDLAAAHGYFTLVYQAAHDRVLPDGVLPEGFRRALSQEAPSAAAAGTDPVEVVVHGARLFTAYQKTEHQYLIEQAITLFRVAIAAGPGHPDRAEWLEFLGTALSVLFDRTEDSALLTEAVQVRREAVAVTGVGDPERAGRLASLCHILPSLFKQTGETGLLAEAVQAGRDAVAATSADDPDRADLLNDLGVALSMLFEENGETALLAEAVQAKRDAVAAAAADDPDRARYQGNLVTALNLEFQRTGEIGVLAETVKIAREAAAAAPAGHRHRAVLVSNLGAALSMLGERTGDAEVLAEAVQAGREGVAATPAGHPDRAERLSNLCDALRALGERTGKTEVLAEAVQAGREGVAATPTGHPDRAVMLSNLAIALHALWDQTGNEGLLGEAVRMGREAVAATPAGHPDRALRFGNLGSALRAMGELTVEDELLAEAVRLDREAVAATPTGHPDRAGRLVNLGNALHSLSLRTGETEMLAEAVQAGREAVAATPAGHPDRFRRLSALGSSLRVMGERTMAVGLLAEAVEVGREAVAATPAGHPDLPKVLSSLGGALLALGEATGQTEVLAEAVQVGRRVVAATPGHPDRAGRLSSLGDALLALGRRTGETWLLTEAVRTGREAVDATPEGVPHRAGWLGNLAIGLFALSMRTMETGLLAEAVQAGREAVAAIPVGDPARSRCLSNLAIALAPLSTRTGDTSLLTEAVRAAREAVAAVPAGHPDRDRLLSNLAAVLLTQPGDAGLLTEAVLVGREAVAAAPAGHPDRARRLRNLGDALRGLSALTGETEPLIEARDCLGEAAENVAAHAMTRIGAYRTLASLATGTGSGQAGLRAAEAAVDLVGMLAPGSLTRPDREYMVSQLAGLAGDVAAAALAAGQPARAVELLEQTRGILVADTLGARGSEQARLRQLAPHLADELSELRTCLDTPDDAAPALVLDTGQDQDAIWEADRLLAAGRRAAYTAWGQLIDRIRAIPGLEDFLQAPRIGQLAGEAHNGPVVIVTASPARCDALILTGTSAHPVQVVPLTTLTVEGAYQHTISLLAARLAAADPDLSSGARAAAQRQILEVLAWLWDTITGPVLTALGHATAPAGNADWPRVWWCPAGIAAFLPLHAAGHHADHADEDPARRAGARAVLDRVISSYITTVRGLAYARAHPPGTTTPQTVIVAVPEAPDAPPLPGVTAETTAITALIPTARVLTDPTRAIVLQALPGHQIAHFACHGLADLADPARSRLILPAGSLTVADISALHLTSGLAFLSACDTTAANPRLADESVHITGAFHLAGYPHVIGSLWAVDDRAAAELAADFYSDLTDHGAIPPDIGRSAHALHHATRRLRAQYPNAPSLWAAYTHTGT